MYEDIFLDVTAALKTLGHHHGDDHFQGKWKDIHWMNTPGPIYCGETDNCGTGPDAAPYNVALDDEAFQVIYRQPVNIDELQQVVVAAWMDPFSAYGADGDQHWSYKTIKEWWAGPRLKVEQEVWRLYDTQPVSGAKEDYEFYRGLARWMDYLKDGMHQYLQVYAFFLDNGRIPTESDTLPEL